MVLTFESVHVHEILNCNPTKGIEQCVPVVLLKITFGTSLFRMKVSTTGLSALIIIMIIIMIITIIIIIIIITIIVIVIIIIIIITRCLKTHFTTYGSLNAFYNKLFT